MKIRPLNWFKKLLISCLLEASCYLDIIHLFHPFTFIIGAPFCLVPFSAHSLAVILSDQYGWEEWGT